MCMFKDVSDDKLEANRLVLTPPIEFKKYIDQDGSGSDSTMNPNGPDSP